jgi:predicted TIM-barrel fold metal-dependent hydrolase
MSYNEQETEEVDTLSVHLDVWQQQSDLEALARFVELRANLKLHVQVLDAAAAAIGDIMSTLEESASPFAEGAMPEWYEQAAGIASGFAQNARVLIESVSGRLKAEYLSR